MKRFRTLVLQALGVLVFCVGALLVPLTLSFAVENVIPVIPEIGWVVGLIAAVLWIWAGVHFIIRPEDPDSTGRKVASVIVFTALFFGHPWLLGFPGRISEFRLEHSLKPGTSEAQVNEIVKNVGGVSHDELARSLSVRFADFGTFCEVSGLDYTITFDDHQTSSSWRSKEWADGC